MRRGVFVCLAAWVTVLVSAADHPLASARAGQAAAAPPRQTPAAVTAKPTAPTPDHAALVKHTASRCHNERLKTAGLALDGVSLTDIPAGAEVWEKVVRKVRAGMMPPVGSPAARSVRARRSRHASRNVARQGRARRARSPGADDASPESRGVRQRDSRPVRAAGRRHARCCLRTRRPSASTISRAS